MAQDNVAPQSNETSEAQASAPMTEAEIKQLVELMAGANRRKRQEASHALALAAQEDAEALVPYVDELIDALYRPEAQTRWEVLTALSKLAPAHPEMVDEAYDGAEASLFDEDSAIVRLAAFRFLIQLGACSPDRSDRVWGIVDEAIQCYHGDPEYRDMLFALSDFARGNISEATRDALIARVGFDAENGRGYVRIISNEIVSVAKGA